MSSELQFDFRHDLIKLLPNGSGNVGVELGVAEGVFSERMIASRAFEMFFGVDMYADIHDVAQYKRALQRIGLFKNYKLLRMTFDEALDLFEDESLDFIYVDGYAHSGEEGGETIYKWARKVKIGGIVAGDDYHRDWPLVVQAVDRFCKDTGFELHISKKTEPDVPYSVYPSWAVVKTRPVDLDAPAQMVRIGKREAGRIGRKRMRSRRVKQIFKRLLGPGLAEKLREINRVRREKRKADM